MDSGWKVVGIERHTEDSRVNATVLRANGKSRIVASDRIVYQRQPKSSRLLAAA